MTRLNDFQHAALLLLTFILIGTTPVAFAQSTDITWTAAGDGATFSDDNNWSTNAGVFGPEFLFENDSLKFNTAGATINNDLDPATNTTSPGAPLQLGLGAGIESTSAAFHFLAGSGDFTFTGFPIQLGPINPNGQGGTVRLDAGAGTLQTFDLDINLTGGQKRRSVFNENGGTVVFNGNVDFANSRIELNTVAGADAGRVEFNGNNLGDGQSGVTAGTHAARHVFRNNTSFATVSLGSDTALGNPNTGTWDAGDLQLRGLTANQILTIETNGPRDLSGYHFQMTSGSGGGAARLDTPDAVSLGYLTRAGNGTRVFSVVNDGVLTIEDGIFTSTANVAQQLGIFAGGTAGNVAGGTGEIVINGRLHTTLIDPVTQATDGTTATGGILPGLTTDVVPGGQIEHIDGTLLNGAITARFGTFALNGDSSATWIGGHVNANASVINVGHDNAFGDNSSIVTVNANATVDIGTHTVAQRFPTLAGRLRGTGSLTNESDWLITGTVQPGGVTPSATDALTFDFSNAAAANNLLFEIAATAEFVLDAGTTSSTVNVVGSLNGGTAVTLNDNTFAFVDTTSGSLTAGTYTLFDGDANTSYNLGVGVVLAGLGDYPGSTISVAGDDLVLNLMQGQSGTLLCDLDADGDCDILDLDMVYATAPTSGDISTWLSQASDVLNPYKTSYAGGTLNDTYVLGDVNLDGDVNSIDLGLLLNNFNSTAGLTWGGGNLNADANVDSIDLGLLLNNFNFNSPASLSAVPEPSGCVLLLLGALAVIRLKRTRK